METTPRFINGVFSFSGTGLENAVSIGGGLGYVVPADKRAQLIYFRAGNSADQVVAISFVRAGKAMRVFPVGAKSAMHVPLVVVEDLEPETVIQFMISAPEGVTGQIVLDIGLIEI